MSEYVDQLKAFFHYTLKHAFAFEFGVRILVEIVILLIIVYIILKFIIRVTSKIVRFLSVSIDFISYDVCLPICKVVTDQLAYKLGSPKWQERADRIKQMILKHDEKQLGQNEKEIEEIEKKKGLAKCFLFAFIILVGYLESFHYLLPNVKENYSVFFLPESIILKGENFLENVVFETDEKAIPCFYDLVHTNEASE